MKYAKKQCPRHISKRNAMKCTIWGHLQVEILHHHEYLLRKLSSGRTHFTSICTIISFFRRYASWFRKIDEFVSIPIETNKIEQNHLRMSSVLQYESSFINCLIYAMCHILGCVFFFAYPFMDKITQLHINFDISTNV